MNWTDYFFSFQGRINRGLMWLFLGIALGAALVLAILSAIVGPVSILFGIFALPVAAALLYALVALSTKRLHDQGRDGKQALMAAGVLVALFVLGAFVPANKASKMIGLAFAGAELLVLLYLFVVLFCLRGTRGSNEYGADPIPPELNPNDPSYVPAGYSVKLSGAGAHQEFYYVAEGDADRACAIVREARGASSSNVTIMGTILHQTVEKLGLRPGEFTVAPNLKQ